MAITTSRVHQYSNGARLQRVVDITFDNSYPTGGYALSVAGAFLRNAIHDVRDGITSGGYVCRYNPTTGKLQLFRIGAALSAALSEVPATTNVSAETVRLVVTGK